MILFGLFPEAEKLASKVISVAFFIGENMKNLFINLCIKLSGKTKEQLGLAWSFHYFVTRSKYKAYWRAVFH